MPGFTPNRSYSYAVPTDPADVPASLQATAESMDDDICALLDTVQSRPAAQFRGSEPYLSPAPATALSNPFGPTRFRLPFSSTDFNTCNAELMSQAAGIRLIRPTEVGVYAVMGILQVPTLTHNASLLFMDLEIHKNDSTTPGTVGARIAASSHTLGVGPDDANVRMLQVGLSVVHMNGTTDAFSLEWRGDTNPDVSDWSLGLRKIMLIKMTNA